MRSWKTSVSVALAALLGAAALLAPAAGAAKRSAYVATDDFLTRIDFNKSSGTMEQIDTATTPIPLGANGVAVALTPDGKHLYVSTSYPSGIAEYRVNKAGKPVELDDSPLQFPDLAGFGGMTITPGGEYLYATTDSGTIFGARIDDDGTLTELSDSPFWGGSGAPEGIATSPDGTHLYVSNFSNDMVEYYEIGDDGSISSGGPAMAGTGSRPTAMAITPDGERLYVANAIGAGLSVYGIDGDGYPVSVAGSPFTTAGAAEAALAIAPFGTRLFLPYFDDTGIGAAEITGDGSPSFFTGSPFAGGTHMTGGAVSPDGDHLYAPDTDGRVHGYEINAQESALHRVAGSPLQLIGGSPPVALDGGYRQSLAIRPNQGPKARLDVAGPLVQGGSISFDAGASTDADGEIADYEWDFGDGWSKASHSPEAAHVYDELGTYQVTLQVRDGEGCSDELVYTGQTATCNGSGAAIVTKEITIGEDRSVYRARLRAKGTQRQRGKRIKVKLRVGAGEPVRVRAAARVKVRGVRHPFQAKAVKTRLAGGKSAKLTLKVKGKRAAKALKRKRRGRARITARFRDDAGNAKVVKKAVKLKR